MLDVILGSWGIEVEKRNPRLCTQAVSVVINTWCFGKDRSQKIHIFILKALTLKLTHFKLFSSPTECRLFFRKDLSDIEDKCYRSESLSIIHLLPRMFYYEFSQSTRKVILQ